MSRNNGAMLLCHRKVVKHGDRHVFLKQLETLFMKGWDEALPPSCRAAVNAKMGGADRHHFGSDISTLLPPAPA